MGLEAKTMSEKGGGEENDSSTHHSLAYEDLPTDPTYLDTVGVGEEWDAQPVDEGVAPQVAKGEDR